MCLTSFQLATADVSKDRPPPLLFDLTPGDPCLNYLERFRVGVISLVDAADKATFRFCFEGNHETQKEGLKNRIRTT